MITEDWRAEDGTKLTTAMWTGKTVFFLTDPVPAASVKPEATTGAAGTATTFVELPPELVPPQFPHIHRPCVRLYKSLYGHPESGGTKRGSLHLSQRP